jgi:hypothetical protein
MIVQKVNCYWLIICYNISIAIEIKPEFIKALDRRSKALENLDRLEESLIGINIFAFMILSLRCDCCLYYGRF